MSSGGNSPQAEAPEKGTLGFVLCIRGQEYSWEKAGPGKGPELELGLQHGLLAVSPERGGRM